MGGRQVLRVGDARRVRFALRLALAGDVATLAPRTQDALWRAARAAVGLPPDPLGQIPGLVRLDRHGRPRPDLQWRARQLEQFAEMQRVARDLLTRAAAGDEITAEFEGRVTLSAAGRRYTGDPVGVFTMTLASDLLEPIGRRVRPCPECGRLFLRVRRQLYCQDSCTDRALWRKYPAEQKRLWPSRRRVYDENGWQAGARAPRAEEP